MEEIPNDTSPTNPEKKSQECGCTDGSCQPKKKNILSKIMFAVILLAAFTIIGIKLVGRPDGASAKQLNVAPGKATECDTTKGNTCDTTKGSSCCPKK